MDKVILFGGKQKSKLIEKILTKKDVYVNYIFDSNLQKLDYSTNAKFI